jgi:hypothetical protein
MSIAKSYIEFDDSDLHAKLFELCMQVSPFFQLLGMQGV